MARKGMKKPKMPKIKAISGMHRSLVTKKPRSPKVKMT